VIEAVGPFGEIASDGAEVRDERGAVLLPGLIDCHVHFPQIAVIGAMGMDLMDWLRDRTLPEEARLADEEVARTTAESFVRALARNGTTTALVFGSHFPGAQAALFEAAQAAGLRVTSGLVVSDRNLLPELEVIPQAAYEASRELIERWHGRGRLRYAVTPRFSVSCSEAMLEVCARLHEEVEGLLFTTHLNEARGEIDLVHELFPWAEDYLKTYEEFDLVHERCVFAHNVHPGDGELGRLAAANASVAHCPSSNAFLGSGIFPMRRHREHGVHFALGSDVGAGTGLSLLKEGLAAYQAQSATGAERLSPGQLLWLATAAGAKALGLDDEVGDLSPGKSADYVLIRPPQDSTLAEVVARSPSLEATLGAIFTLAREDAVATTCVAGKPVP
jgi:guanine deaminase